MEETKVKKLVDKAKKVTRPPQSEATIEDTLYGPETENDNASGAGEFDA